MSELGDKLDEIRAELDREVPDSDLPYIEPQRLSRSDADKLEVGDRFRFRVYGRELIVAVKEEHELPYSEW